MFAPLPLSIHFSDQPNQASAPHLNVKVPLRFPSGCGAGIAAQFCAARECPNPGPAQACKTASSPKKTAGRPGGLLPAGKFTGLSGTMKAGTKHPVHRCHSSSPQPRNYSLSRGPTSKETTISVFVVSRRKIVGDRLYTFSSLGRGVFVWVFSHADASWKRLSQVRLPFVQGRQAPARQHFSPFASIARKIMLKLQFLGCRKGLNGMWLECGGPTWSVAPSSAAARWSAR